ncbi:hypothetical protein LguiB_018109 [Lonicera macranthoides]
MSPHLRPWIHLIPLYNFRLKAEPNRSHFGGRNGLRKLRFLNEKMRASAKRDPAILAAYSMIRVEGSRFGSSILYGPARGTAYRVPIVVTQLGANAILAVSLAVRKAGARVKKIPIYKSVLKKKYGEDVTNVGVEDGFAPNIQENKQGLELLRTATANAGYTG